MLNFWSTALVHLATTFVYLNIVAVTSEMNYSTFIIQRPGHSNMEDNKLHKSKKVGWSDVLVLVVSRLKILLLFCGL